MNENNEIVYLYVDDIIPNRFQPRQVFDEDALNELADSIKEHGVIQPIIVRKIDDRYEIVAGERRYKASILAGLTRIPAIIRNMDDSTSAKVALLENLQRKNLTPIEEARTYQKIIELDNLTQEELGKTMGKSQAAIANKLRLLSLPHEVQEALLKQQISERHARSLLNIDNNEQQIRLLSKIVNERLTVKALDEEIKRINNPLATNSVDFSQYREFSPETPIPVTKTTPAPREESNMEEQRQYSQNQYQEPTKQPYEQIQVPNYQPVQDVPQPHSEPVQEEPERNAYRFIPDFEEKESPQPKEQPIELPKLEPVSTAPYYQEPVQEKIETPQYVEPTIPDVKPVQPVPRYEEPILPKIEAAPVTPPVQEEPKPPVERPYYEEPILPKIETPKYEDKESKPIERTQRIEPILAKPKPRVESSVSTPGTNYQDGINAIKEAVQELQSKGLNIVAEELDFGSRYQIVVKIDKGS